MSVAVLSRSNATIPTSRSPVPSFMPRTPPASRPIGRTFSSRNRTARPLAEVRSTSWAALVIATDTRRSVSSSEIALMPVTRIFSNADSSVFFTVPLSVARNTVRSSLKPWSGSIDTTSSPSCSSITLTNGLPFDVRAPSGSSYTFLW